MATRAVAAKATPQTMVRQGNGWLAAAAGFTALNTVLFLLDMDFRMLIGTVSTLFALYATDGGTVAVVGSFAVAGVFGALAYLTSKGQGWALLAATAIYGLDTIFTLYILDWMGLIWHAATLIFLIRGIVGLRQMNQPALQGAYAPAQPTPAVAGMPSAAAWLPDPSGRHQLRYHDGSSWTAHVSDAGVTASDPIG